MGLFRKKPDPLAQRAQSLNRRIAELEAEIARLNHGLEPPPNAPIQRPAPTNARSHHLPHQNRRTPVP
jgi:hypothetical protein